jgi:hypothetical protein
MSKNESIYSQFRMWQTEAVGASIFINEVEKIQGLIKKYKPGLVVQLEGRPLLDQMMENMLYYHVSEDPSVEAVGFTVEAEQGFLPFPDNSVDLLIIAHAIELYQNTHTIMAECERVLSQKGVACVMVLISRWFEGGIPAGLHPLGDLKMASVSLRKFKEATVNAGLMIESEHSLANEQSYLLGERITDMMILPMEYELKRMDVCWNGVIGVVE